MGKKYGHLADDGHIHELLTYCSISSSLHLKVKMLDDLCAMSSVTS